MGIFEGDLTPLFRVLLKVGNLIEIGVGKNSDFDYIIKLRGVDKY